MDLLEQLYTRNPFASKMFIPVYDIPYLYVRFDEMTRRSTEGVILEDIRKDRLFPFYMLIAPSGSGKSSFLHFLLHESYKSRWPVFPIKVDEFVEETVDAKQLLRHLLKKVSEQASLFNKLDKKMKQKAQKLMASEFSFTSGEREKLGGKVTAWLNAIPAILGIKSEVSAEIESFSQTVLKQDASVDDLIMFVNQLSDLLAGDAKKVRTMFLIDETDKILDATSKFSPERASMFFKKVVPLLSKTKATYLFVANSQYDTPQFHKDILESLFDRIIKIPAIESKEGLRKIVYKRTSAAIGEADPKKLWSDEALEFLFRLYKDRSLRDVMWVCRVAVENAWKEPAAAVDIGHVKDAALECFA